MKKWITRGVITTLALVVWWMIAPPELLGQTTLLTTRGNSMQPLVHQGDLAILRKAGSYKVGDVIAYHADSLNSTVMHRIVRIGTDGITTKGDNNSWEDLDHPRKSQIRGRLIQLEPGGGKALDVFKSQPIRLLVALISGLCAYFAIRSWRKSKAQSLTAEKPTTRTPKKPKVPKGTKEPKRTPLLPGRIPRSGLGQPLVNNVAVIATLAAILVFAGSITVAAFAQPSVHSKGGDAFYTMRGIFNYSAATKQGGHLAYADGQVSTGDTVYYSLVDDLFVTYAYSYEGTTSFSGGGTLSLDAIIKGKTGWSHRIPLVERSPFNGSSTRANAVVSLTQVKSLVQEVQKLTAVRDGSYTVELQATVRPVGTVGGQPFHDELVSTMALTSDGATLVPQKTADNTTDKTNPTSPTSPVGTKDATKEQTDKAGMSSSKGGLVHIPAGTPAQLKALGVTLGIFVVRFAGLTITLGALLGLSLIFGLRIRRQRAVTPKLDDIDKEHRSLVVPVTGSVSAATHDNVIDLKSLNDLARVAQLHNMLILHETNPDGMTFVVNFDNTTYRYLRKETSAQDRFGATIPEESNL